MTYLCDAVREHVGSGSGAKVLEFGSYNVNGTARDAVPGARVHGVDIRGGNGVDEVADAATYDGDEHYDLVLCAEALEHMRDPAAVIEAARRSLKPGGLLIATMAAPERAPHSNDGGGVLARGEHYAGISKEALKDYLAGWEVLDMHHLRSLGDLYVTARRL
jgi:2-polyprenyl-3-methyl-5-hydroxy-6-metoxy-1,4-benzoquinol methylase